MVPEAPNSVLKGPASGAHVKGCQLVQESIRIPSPRRVIAIGDLHGDFGGMEAALRAGGAIDETGHWRGGDLVVVQTGDLLDRGDDEQRIIDNLERLETEARAAGGDLIWLLGNHELMNAAGDFRYVTPGGFLDFEDTPKLDLGSVAARPKMERARMAAFATFPSTGPYAKILAGQDTIRIVGDTVFSHAGLTESWAARAQAVNLENRCWLAGQVPALPVPSALSDDSSPVWTRAFGTSEVDCGMVRRALAELGSTRMVIGHTVQPDGISSECDGALWRIDVGLAALYGGPIQVLQISGGVVTVLRGPR
jgi:Calcineurin-like phosphoesterase